MFQPKVSVIVTTYNRPLLLKETLNGILDQTFQDFELIVVDNFSDYDFLNLINEFNEKRIRPFQNRNNGIIAVNRNFGIKKAKGNYLAFCDDDDIWLPNKLEKQMSFLKLNELCDKDFLICSNSLNFTSHKEKVTKKKKIKSLNDLIKSNQVILSTVMIKNNHRHELKFNELKEFLAIEDFLLWVDLKVKGFDFFLIEEPLVKYRLNENSVSSSSIGLSNLRRVYALVFLKIKYEDLNINYFTYCYSIVKNVFKYSIKKALSK